MALSDCITLICNGNILQDTCNTYTWMAIGCEMGPREGNIEMGLSYCIALLLTCKIYLTLMKLSQLVVNLCHLMSLLYQFIM
jgi:hypothetical protein